MRVFKVIQTDGLDPPNQKQWPPQIGRSAEKAYSRASDDVGDWAIEASKTFRELLDEAEEHAGEGTQTASVDAPTQP